MVRTKKYWSLSEFKKVVKTSSTIKSVLQHFKLPGNQGSYNRLFHKYVNEHKIDISHIVNNTDRIFQKKISSEEFFIEGTFREGRALKKRLIEENILEDKCSACLLLNNWNGKLLVLQLDHINGINTDNRIKNLRLLCPNCHSQTDTFGGKNTKAKYAHKYICKSCGGPKTTTKSDECISCANSNKNVTKIVWPSYKEVYNLANTVGFCAAGRKLGVSDNAIRKFLKRAGRQ